MTRSRDQNAKLHAMLADIIDQHPVDFGGRPMDLYDWKATLMLALGHKVRMGVNPFDGSVCSIMPRTSRMSVGQCADAIEQLYAKGAEWGIAWSGPEEGV